MITAVVTGISRAPRNSMMLPLDPAFVARSHATGKALFFHVFQTGVIIAELHIEVHYRVLLSLREYVVSALNVAHVESMPSLLLVVKG